MIIDGDDALEYAFSGQASMMRAELKYEELEACTALGIAYSQYVELPGTRKWCTTEPMSKCDVLMWYRYHKIVPLVLEDISAKRSAMKRRS